MIKEEKVSLYPLYPSQIYLTPEWEEKNQKMKKIQRLSNTLLLPGTHTQTDCHGQAEHPGTLETGGECNCGIQ